MDTHTLQRVLQKPLSLLLLLPLIPTLFLILHPPFSSGPTLTASPDLESSNTTFPYPPCVRPVCSSISAPRESLASYLSSRFPQPTDPAWPYLWITLADDYWVDNGAANLHYFVYEKLNRWEERRTELVMMCMDDKCMEKCERRGWWCFGGWMEGKPDILLRYTYPKLMSMIEILESGRDVFFVDSDVYFVDNPYPHMGELSKYDLQIQEEMINRQINTGWLHMNPNENTVDIWKSILDVDMHEVSRDQVNMNNLLKSYVHRIQPSGGTFRDFMSETGLLVRVLPKEKFRAFHFYWNEPQWDMSELVYLHMTCADQNNMKDYVAASLGYYQDVFSRYSSPPSILTVSTLSGTPDHLASQLRILLAIAHFTGRAFMPPLHATVIDVEGGPPTTVNSWNVFPFDRLGGWIGVDIREAEYDRHARKVLLEKLGSSSNEDELGNAVESMKKLDDLVDLDIRGFKSLGHAIKALMSEGERGSWRDEGWAMEDAYYNQGIGGGEKGLKGRGVVRINVWELWDAWRNWRVPKRVERFVDLCANVQEGPDCGRLCRDNPSTLTRINGGELEEAEWHWEDLAEVVRW